MELTPTSKSDLQNVIGSSAISPNLISRLTQTQFYLCSIIWPIIGIIIVACPGIHSFWLSVNTLVLLGWSFVLIMMINFIAPNRKPIFFLPVIGWEMDMRDNKEWEEDHWGTYGKYCLVFKRDTWRILFSSVRWCPRCKLWSCGNPPGTMEQSGWQTKPKQWRWPETWR